MKKNGFLKSSAILIVSVILAKAAGAVFRIPLANMLGGTGMAYFGGAYGIFLPVYAVFVTGLSTAAAGLTAEYNVFYGNAGAERVKKCALVLFSVIGTAGTVIMIVFAGPFAEYAADSKEIRLSVMVIAPSVLFSCITAAYRGFAEGQCNMYPTAVSQTAESFVKMISGLAICMTVIHNSEYFKELLHEITDDSTAVAAAGAAAGVTLSSFTGMIYLIVHDVLSRKRYVAAGFAVCSESRRFLAGRMITAVIPLALSALLSNLTSVADLCTVMRFIKVSSSANPEYFYNRYSFLKDTGLSDFPEFAYGSYCGMAVTVFNLVPSLTNMFGKSIFPEVADAYARKDKEQAVKAAEKVIKITALAAVPAGLGINVLAGRILKFLFPSSLNEAELCADSLRYLGIAVIFMCITFPVFSILQAAGKADVPAKIMAFGLVVKTVGNIVLVRIPELNISGAALSTLLCYAAVLLCAWKALGRYCSIGQSFCGMFFKPVYAGLLCMAAAGLAESAASGYLGNTAVLFISVISGGLVYVLAVYLLGEYKLVKQLLIKEKM